MRALLLGLVLASLIAPSSARTPLHTVADEPASPASSASGDGELVRITSSFESSHAGAVLRQVARIFSAGFVRRDADALARQIDVLPADQIQRWEFKALYKGVSVPLQIRARLDDFGMLDLDFFTAAVVAPQVRTAVDTYLNARGL